MSIFLAFPLIIGLKILSPYLLLLCKCRNYPIWLAANVEALAMWRYSVFRLPGAAAD